MAARLTSLVEFRRSLDLNSVVLRLTREGYEEGAVRRAIDRIRFEGERSVTMAEVLVYARRQLDLASRTQFARRR